MHAMTNNLNLQHLCKAPLLIRLYQKMRSPERDVKRVVSLPRLVRFGTF